MTDNDADRIVRMLRVSESDPLQMEAADCIERLRAELAAERERASKWQRLAAELSDKLNGTPCAEIRWQEERAKLREALEQVLIGGNHIALLIGADHPPYTASHDEARTYYKTSQDTYEIWCCWRTMMLARVVLAETGAGDE